jgi:phenylacetate-CoA ligase
VTQIRYWNHRYEGADRDEIRALQLLRVQELVGRAYVENAFYREHLGPVAADPRAISSIAEFAARIPTISKADFVADQQTLPPYGRRHTRALELEQGLFVYTTSGTSGQGQEIHMQTRAELEVTSNAVYPYLFRWAGLNPGDPLMLAMPVSMLGGGRLEYHGAIGYGLTMIPAGSYEAHQKVELIHRFRPRGIMANTSYLGRLGSLLAADDEARDTVATVLTGGEGSGFAWLERLQETWGATVADRYGSSQAGNDHMFTCEIGIGTPSRPGMLHNIEPSMLVEVVDPETGTQVADGEQGELVITNLYRMDTPLIRWRTGDRATYREAGYCGCGRPFSGVEVCSISRMDDMRKIKGVNVWPQAVDDALFAMPSVGDYQVVLTSTPGGADAILVRVLAAGGGVEDDRRAAPIRDEIAENLHRKVGLHFTVELVEESAFDPEQWKARRWVDQRTHLATR